jgi:predicted aspartyl protease
MITGYVTAKLEAQIRVYFEDGGGQTHPIDAAIYTGFCGFISLRPATVANLGLPWLHFRDVQLVDGSIALVPVYTGVVIWDGQPRTVDVHAVNTEPLVGMKMLLGHDVRIHVVDGGPVSIDVIP